MWNVKSYRERNELGRVWMEEIREILSISALLNYWSISTKFDPAVEISTIEIDINGELGVAINIDSMDQEYDVFAENEEMENRFEFYGISQEQICVSFKTQSEVMEFLTNVFVEYSVRDQKEGA